jgi:zinc protease
VSVRSAFAGGVLQESVANSGLTALTAKLLIKGAGARTSEQIANDIESLGGGLSPFSGNHSFGLSADLLKEGLPEALGLYFDVLRRPTFPSAELERERGAQLASIRGQRDHLLSCAFRQVRRQLFGAAGYGLDPVGLEESVRDITREAVADWHARYASPANAVFAVFGAIATSKASRTSEVRDAFEVAMAGWAPGIPAPAPAPVAKPDGPGRSVENRDKEQAVVALGFPGAVLGHDDQFPLEVIEEACSSMGSRLFVRIRDTLGLAYYVGASNFPGIVPGYFALYCGTAPAEATRVEEELRLQAEALRRDGLEQEELDRAKAKILGQKKISLQDQGALATQAALDELTGLGFDRHLRDDAKYAAVTRDSVREAAERYFDPARAVVGIQLGG